MKRLMSAVLICTLSLLLVLSGCSGGSGSGGTTPVDNGTNNDTTTDSNTNLNSNPQNTHLLTIDKFGGGTVLDDQSKMNCGDACVTQYEDGETIVLTANPSNGWAFDHWAGCDSSAENVCTVMLTHDKTVFPSFATETTTLRTEVKQLDSSVISHLTDTAGSTLIFDSSAPTVTSLQPGDVIISQVGSGFAKKVTNVTTLQASSTLVETTDATLEDIIQEGTIIYNQPLTVNDLQSAKRLMKGARLITKAADLTLAQFKIDIDHVLYDADGNDQTTNDQVKLIGSTIFEFTPDFAVSVGLTGVNEFKSVMHINNNTSLTLAENTTFSLVKKELPLYKFTFAPVLVGPVVLTPIIEVKALLAGKASAGITASVSFEQTTSVGVHYLASTGWKPVGNYSKSLSFNQPTINGSIDLEGGIGAQTEVLIYGVTGPFAILNPYLEAKATETVGASQQCIDWGLYAGVRSTAGAEAKILSWKLAKYEATLFDFNWTLAKGNVGNCIDNEAPSAPANFNATTVSSSQILLSWTASTDNIIVDKYTIYRDGKLIGETSSTSHTESNLQPATQYCYSIAASDLSGNESQPSGAQCATTRQKQDSTPPATPQNFSVTALSSSAAQLTWSTSADDTGVAGYTVFRDSMPIISTVDVTANDLGLKPGKTYCYKIKANDAAGNESLPSNEECITTQVSGAWDVYLKCESMNYNLKNNMDLNETLASNIQVTGTGTDYDGVTSLAYVITGSYDTSSNILDGRMTMTFDGSSCVRVDTFTADLSSSDNGDVTMNQIQQCGCTAQIRFVKAGGTPLMSPSLSINKTGTAVYTLFHDMR